MSYPTVTISLAARSSYESYGEACAAIRAYVKAAADTRTMDAIIQDCLALPAVKAYTDLPKEEGGRIYRKANVYSAISNAFKDYVNEDWKKKEHPNGPK